ncbi:acyl-CoA N-acyltransferase [Piedraia hortae CBS 480.64]|uniref:Acyl-CoA N-acyltransferase n=1 Tax=Piedraia hortae CBS 480.64 TaxID=1314780 RepID=A0A6A7BZ21_9PEZI|nr:acyl-CoA N-acyltransferase [Piedraia hortae CBS 480.64]
MANASTPTITLATSDDVGEILAMIRELAKYQNALDKVEATEDSLRRTLTFSGGTQRHNPGYAKTFLLRLPAKPSHEGDEPRAVAGMAMFFHSYSTWRACPGVHLEDLYVRPQYRKRGYGKMLIQACAQEVARIGGARLEWSCLKNNKASLEFYDSLGAKQMPEWVSLRVDGDDLSQLYSGETLALREGQDVTMGTVGVSGEATA